jgi:predicted dithiol-disulfide oxidoreductase (DUF899 family)
MVVPQIVPRAEWLTARDALLAQEKEVTRARDALAERRRALPMVLVEQDYLFDGPGGPVSLLDLFAGRTQLIIYHFMWMGDQGCSSCSLLADGIGHPAHLAAADTSRALVSRAPFGELDRFRERMQWDLPFYSSAGSTFNEDFDATVDGVDAHGVSVFLRQGEAVLHTYSTYRRGVDALLSTYNWLDLTPLGRQRYVNEFPHHDALAATGCH